MRCHVEDVCRRMLIFSRKVLKGRGKRTRCPRQPIVDMDVDCRRPRHDENHSSLFVENSHPGDLTSRHVSHAPESLSGPKAPPLRAMPIHKIVSKERCQSYFIDGCRRIKIDEPASLVRKRPSSVPLHFCMARSYANFQYSQSSTISTQDPAVGDNSIGVAFFQFLAVAEAPEDSYSEGACRLAGLHICGGVSHVEHFVCGETEPV